MFFMSVIVHSTWNKVYNTILGLMQLFIQIFEFLCKYFIHLNILILFQFTVHNICLCQLQNINMYDKYEYLEWWFCILKFDLYI